MKFTHSEKKLTIEEIIAFEKKFNLKLTDFYKKIILEYNGGYPEKEFFKGKAIYFEPIKYGESTLDDSLEMLRDVLPKGFFPFGSDGGGWLFCLNLNFGEDYGKVYFFQEDGEYYILSDSLTKFMNELSDNEDY